MSYGVVQAEKMTTESGYSLGAGNASSFKNRLINGGQVIDQRNAGAAVTLTEGGNNFITDRFQTYKANSSVTITGQRSSVAPSGFINSLLFTTTTGASIGAANEGQVRQNLEGLNIADLAWGTASAQPITISFWVRSSLTGTFALAIQSPTVDAVYVSTYTISSANTFEYKTVTIPGPTSGTFPTTNGTGFSLLWDIGGGSNFNAASANTWTSGNRYTVAGTQKVMSTTGATWYITGVQLEVGTVATSFDFRSYGTEMALCQRYYYQSVNYGSVSFVYGEADFGVYGALVGANGWMWAFSKFPVKMRSAPTVTTSDQAGTTGKLSIWTSSGGSVTNGVTPYTVYTTVNSYSVSVYTEAKYGFYGAIKADSEL